MIRAVEYWILLLYFNSVVKCVDERYSKYDILYLSFERNKKKEGKSNLRSFVRSQLFNLINILQK